MIDTNPHNNIRTPFAQKKNHKNFNKSALQSGRRYGALRFIMSLSSEKIYKRKPSIIVRQHLLNVLLRKYIKKVYGGVVASDGVKQIDLRHQYYSDINECLFNYCQLTKHTNLLKTVNQFSLTNQTSGSRKRKKVVSLRIVDKNSRWVLSPLSTTMCQSSRQAILLYNIYLQFYKLRATHNRTHV